jgi:hypothetical protein
MKVEQTDSKKVFKDDTYLGYIMNLTDEFRILTSGTGFEAARVVVVAGPQLWQVANRKGWTKIAINGLRLSINLYQTMPARDFLAILESKNGFQFELGFVTKGEDVLATFQIRQEPADGYDPQELDRILRRLLDLIPGIDQPDTVMIRRTK